MVIFSIITKTVSVSKLILKSRQLLYNIFLFTLSYIVSQKYTNMKNTHSHRCTHTSLIFYYEQLHCRAWWALLHDSLIHTSSPTLCSSGTGCVSSFPHCFGQTFQTDHWQRPWGSEPDRDSSTWILFQSSSWDICRCLDQCIHDHISPPIPWRSWIHPSLFPLCWYI